MKKTTQQLSKFDELVFAIMRDGRANDGTTLAGQIFEGASLKNYHYRICRQSIGRLHAVGLIVRDSFGWYRCRSLTVREQIAGRLN